MLQEYTKLAGTLSKINLYLDESPQAKMSSNQRVFIYVACISSMYSALESFADRLAYRFAEMLLTCPGAAGSDALTKLEKRYTVNVAQLLNYQLGIGRYETLTSLDLATSLTSCLDGTDIYKLRSEAVAFHSANLRFDTLIELYQWASQDLKKKLVSSDAVKAWAVTVERESDVTGLIAAELLDLVQRRNEVSHRAPPSEIVSHEKLRAKLLFIDALGRGLVAVLCSHLISSLGRIGSTNSIGVIDERYKEGRIAVVNMTTTKITVGDLVVVQSCNSSRWGKILDLHWNDNPVNTIPKNNTAGIRLDFKCRKGAEILLVKEFRDELALVPQQLFGNHGPYS